MFLYFKSGSMGSTWSTVETSKGVQNSLTKAVESCLGVVVESNYADFPYEEQPHMERKIQISRLRRLLRTAKKAGSVLQVVTRSHWGCDDLEESRETL